MNLVTHNGVFHADETLATAILLGCFPEACIVRTRDAKIIAEATVVYDVGGMYDHSVNRYDHHQRGGAGTRENGVPYSSAGLIWQHYGDMHLQAQGYEQFLNELWAEVDEALIQSVDAVDNGVIETQSYHKGNETEIQVQDFSGLVSAYNPCWHEDQTQSDTRFHQAVAFATTVLNQVIASAYGKLLAKDKVLGSKILDQSILILDRFMPWQEVVVEHMPNILFVVFPDVSGTWRVQVVPKELSQFCARKDLPETWAGLRGEELQALTGVLDAIFCHNGKFIAGADTREGALALAKLAL